MYALAERPTFMPQWGSLEIGLNIPASVATALYAIEKNKVGTRLDRISPFLPQQLLTSLHLYFDRYQKPFLSSFVWFLHTHSGLHLKKYQAKLRKSGHFDVYAYNNIY